MADRGVKMKRPQQEKHRKILQGAPSTNISGAKRSSGFGPEEPAKRHGGHTRGAQNIRIYKQVASAVARLLAADASKHGGASIKALTLAPGNVAKKATHALTCETLRHLPVIQQLVSTAGLLPGADVPGRGAGLRGSGKRSQRKAHKDLQARASDKGGLWAELVYVVTYDVLFGKGQAATAAAGAGSHERAEGRGVVPKTVKLVVGHRTALNAALARLLVREGKQSVEELLGPAGMDGSTEGKQGRFPAEDLAARFPRYARVNELKTTTEEVLGQLQRHHEKDLLGKHQAEAAANTNASVTSEENRDSPSVKRRRCSNNIPGAALDLVARNEDAGPMFNPACPGASHGGWVEQDPLLPAVLRFPPGTDLHDHPLVRSGGLLLQGWASCVPAVALGPQRGAHVLDACAAPGNKTTHLAALVGAGGRVTACERDARRASVLQATVARAGAGGIVNVVLGDFLQLDTAAPEFADVRAVLVDPSCSGSGTVASRMDHLLPSHRSIGGARESALLRGASGGMEEAEHEGGTGAPGGNSSKSAAVEQRLERLAAFQEAALRHALRFPHVERVVYSTCSVEERENEGVVAHVLAEADALGFQLEPVLPAWSRRGLDSHPFGPLVLRTRPDEDLVDGFFVALFAKNPRRSSQDVILTTAVSGGVNSGGEAGNKVESHRANATKGVKRLHRGQQRGREL